MEINLLYFDFPNLKAHQNTHTHSEEKQKSNLERDIERERQINIVQEQTEQNV